MFFGLRKWELVDATTLDIPGAGARIDLSRAEQLDTVNGWAIVQQETPIGSDGVALGEGETLRDVLAGQTLKDAWFSTLGTRPDGDNLNEILFDHLESKADPTGVDTARPLELAAGNLEVWLGSRQKAVIPFANGTTQERAAFVRMVQRVRTKLNAARDDSNEGRAPADLYLKLLTVEARKLGVSPDSLKPKTWRANERAKEPTTTNTDNFSGTLGNFTSIYNGSAPTWAIDTGELKVNSDWDGMKVLRHNGVLSSSDNWTISNLHEYAGHGHVNHYAGIMCRYGGNSKACYALINDCNDGGSMVFYLVRFNSTGSVAAYLNLTYGDAVTYAPVVGYQPLLEVRASGSSISRVVTGTPSSLARLTVTDTVNSTGLYGGYVAQGDQTITNYPRWYNFSNTDGVTAPPVVTSNSASGTTGVAFSYSISATNTPTSYGASGLPSGLSVNTSTGAITGTPTQSGSFSVSLSATNAGGTGTGTLTLNISAPATTTTTSTTTSTTTAAPTTTTTTTTTSTTTSTTTTTTTTTSTSTTTTTTTTTTTPAPDNTYPPFCRDACVAYAT